MGQGGGSARRGQQRPLRNDWALRAPLGLQGAHRAAARWHWHRAVLGRVHGALHGCGFGASVCQEHVRSHRQPRLDARASRAFSLSTLWSHPSASHKEKRRKNEGGGIEKKKRGSRIGGWIQYKYEARQETFLTWTMEVWLPLMKRLFCYKSISYSMFAPCV